MRPKHLDLTKIRLPLPGIVSIFHRASGAALFLMLPFILYMFAGTLSSEEAFQNYQAWISHPLIKIILIGLLWCILHHACAGMRFLLLDVHQGVSLPTARLSAKLVLFVSLVLTGVIGAYLW